MMKRIVISFLYLISIKAYGHLHHADTHRLKQLFTQAQENAGIHKPLPIELLDSQDAKNHSILATTSKSTISINTEKLAAVPHGVAVATAAHEASHAKNNDPERVANLIQTSRLAVGAATYATLASLGKNYRLSLSLAASALIGAITQRLALLFVETRADRDGIYATACASCAQEVLAYTKVMQAQGSLDACYLAPEKIAVIVEDLKDQLCDHHAQQAA